jgi:hypothetical protein
VETLILNHAIIDICRMIAILVEHVVLTELVSKLILHYAQKLMDRSIQMLDVVN